MSSTIANCYKRCIERAAAVENGTIEKMELNGYSGCRLCVIEKNGVKRIKKESPDSSYNSRLIRQKQKQEALRLKGFEQCTVFSDGMEQGRYYFTMEYINGKTMAESMEALELDKIRDFTWKIMQNISEYKVPNQRADEAFKTKVTDLKKQLRKNKKLDAAFGLLESFSWKYVVDSECHGDLTLQNILVQDGELYLIDCLDSFYDSWVIDMAKILQDVDAMWSYRNIRDRDSNSNRIVRLTVMRDLMIERIRQMYRGEELLVTLYYTLLLHLVRIFPYLQDKMTRLFLEEKIRYVVRKIDNGSWRE